MELAIIIGVAISTFTAFTYVFVYLDELERELRESNCHFDARIESDEREARDLKHWVFELENKSNDRT